MAEEEEGSGHGGENHHLDSTLAKMADFFEDQRTRWNGQDRHGVEVSDDLALERF